MTANAAVARLVERQMAQQAVLDRIAKAVRRDAAGGTR